MDGKVERIRVVTPWNGKLGAQTSFGHFRVIRCGADPADVGVSAACAIGSAEDGANIEGAAQIIEEDVNFTAVDFRLTVFNLWAVIWRSGRCQRRAAAWAEQIGGFAAGGETHPAGFMRALEDGKGLRHDAIYSYTRVISSRGGQVSSTRSVGVSVHT